MEVKSSLRIEDYLSMSFEHDKEFVRGKVVGRSSPTFSHSNIQDFFSAFFRSHRQSQNLYGCPELRVRISEDLARIPDYCVFMGRPAEVPEAPPLVAVEITSPDDRAHDLFEKLGEYHEWGVRHVWMVEAQHRLLFTFDGTLTQVNAFEIPDYGISIPATEIFT